MRHVWRKKITSASRCRSNHCLRTTPPACQLRPRAGHRWSPPARGQSTAGRKRPPRVRKPLPRNDQCLAPTTDLEGHRAALRQAFGNTLSDEFVSVLLSKLISALRPGPNDELNEATLNAAIAV